MKLLDHVAYTFPVLIQMVSLPPVWLGSTNFPHSWHHLELPTLHFANLMGMKSFPRLSEGVESITSLSGQLDNDFETSLGFYPRD